MCIKKLGVLRFGTTTWQIYSDSFLQNTTICKYFLKVKTMIILLPWRLSEWNILGISGTVSPRHFCVKSWCVGETQCLSQNSKCKSRTAFSEHILIIKYTLIKFSHHAVVATYQIWYTEGQPANWQDSVVSLNTSELDCWLLTSYLWPTKCLKGKSDRIICIAFLKDIVPKALYFTESMNDRPKSFIEQARGWQWQ